MLRTRPRLSNSKFTCRSSTSDGEIEHSCAILGICSATCAAISVVHGPSMTSNNLNAEIARRLVSTFGAAIAERKIGGMSPNQGSRFRHDSTVASGSWRNMSSISSTMKEKRHRCGSSDFHPACAFSWSRRMLAATLCTISIRRMCTGPVAVRFWNRFIHLYNLASRLSMASTISGLGVKD